MLSCPNKTNHIATGANYFLKGACLIWRPGLRRYMLVPLAVNLVLMVVLTSIFVQYFDEFVQLCQSYIPSFLAPLVWLVWIVIGTLTLLLYGYSFNVITNFIAAPFYGLLAEQAEKIICGKEPPPEPLGKMILRVMLREFRKIIYFLSRGILIGLIVLLLSLTFSSIPIIQFAGPLLGLAWAAWSMTIQYVDYPADNHQQPFRALRKKLWVKRYSSLGFGGMVMALTVVPIVNIFVMPAAVVGGTLFWSHELKACDITLTDEFEAISS